MQQFTVPQFIDVEDKIIGPITTRQFIIMLVAGLIIAVLYKIFYFTAFLISSLGVIFIFGTVAFVRINGRPFHYFILNFIQTMRRHRLRVWQRKETAVNEVEKREDESLEKTISKKEKIRYTKSRLNELSLIVDTQGAYRGEEDDHKVIFSEKNIKNFEELDIV